MAVANVKNEQYHSTPKLFELDDYEQCLTNSRGVFCLGTFDLLPYKNDKLLETLKVSCLLYSTLGQPSDVYNVLNFVATLPKDFGTDASQELDNLAEQPDVYTVLDFIAALVNNTGVGVGQEFSNVTNLTKTITT
ncbi:hypothetical protein K1T71_011556 [Dendrolimus kikuchii]|uniref:Uncharacterized protein n=1 Tax=Dendrolimus kikuchii TaxID=765133 RepID=A0ACC1CPD5_9NEOP|nr:hypothetical protein K1T71_011556 [Dendrolimus kikuchii]